MTPDEGHRSRVATVVITFNYEPDNPDDDDPTGLSSEEFNEVTEKLFEIMGADNIEIKKAS